MAVDDRIFEGVLQQSGMIRVDSLGEFIDTCKAFSVYDGEVRGNRVAIMTYSGALGVLSSDQCIQNGLKLAKFSDETNKKIDGTNQRIDETNQRIDETNKRIDEASRRIDETNLRIGEETIEMNKRLDRLYEAVVRRDEHEKLQSRLIHLEQQVDKIKLKLAA